MWDTMWFSEIGIFERLMLYGIFAGVVLYSSYVFMVKWIKKPISDKSSRRLLYVEASLIVMAVALRIFLVKINPSANYDFQVFVGWSESIYKFGIKNVYAETPNLDYPPIYVMLLGLLKTISVLFKAESGSLLHSLIYRLPAFICDFLCAGIIFKVAENKKDRYMALFLSATYLFNPAILINNCIYGQIDSVPVLFMILSLYLLYEQRLISSGIFYTISLLIKPQPLFIAPVYIFVVAHAIYEFVSKKNVSMLKDCMFAILISAAIFFTITLPFSGGRGLFWAVSVYTGAANSYPIASLGAFNFFGMFGGIGTGMSTKFMFLTFDKWSKIFLVASPVVGALTYFFVKDRTRTLISALVTYTTIYTFAGGMHERYLYPTLIMLVFSYILTGGVHYLNLYALFSLINYACVARSMFATYIGQNTDKSPPSYVFSTLMVVGYIFMIKAVKRPAESA